MQVNYLLYQICQLLHSNFLEWRNGRLLHTLWYALGNLMFPHWSDLLLNHEGEKMQRMWIWGFAVRIWISQRNLQRYQQSNSTSTSSFKQETYLHLELCSPAWMFNSKTLPIMVDKYSFIIRFGSNIFLSARPSIRIHEV